MICRSGLLLPLALLLALPAVVQAADDLQVTAKLQPGLVGINELAHFSIEVSGSGFGGRGFTPEMAFENLEIISGPNSSQSFRFVNGAASRSLTLSWVLRPLAVGNARVHNIQVQLGETLFEPPAVSIEIQQGTVGRTPDARQRPRDPLEQLFPRFDRRPSRRRAAPKVFMRAEVEPKDPWVGQQSLYTLFLFTQIDVHAINPEQLPDFNGCWVRELEQGTADEQEMVEIDGERFARVPVLRRAIFPLRAGPIELGAAKVQLTVRMPASSFGSMFAQTEHLRRDSNAVTLIARALPAGAPANFDNAVGDLRATVELDPPAVEVGDAATFSVTLSGRGHLQGLPAPSWPELAGVRTFPPQQESSEHLAGNRVHGRRTWRYVLVPETVGSFVLPAIHFPYFDPDRGEFLTASSEITTLEVSAATAAAPALADSAASDSAPAGSEATRGTSAAEGGTTKVTAAGWLRTLPWLLVALLVATLSIVLLRSRRQQPAGSPAAALRTALRSAALESRPKAAAAAIEEGWRTFLAERWQIPPSTPSTQWERLLSATGAPAAGAQELVRLADDVHYLRYAPKLADTAALQEELILRSTKLGRALK